MFEILTVRTLKRGKLRRRAEFRGNQLNSCGDMTIFRFLKTVAAAMSDF